jgi:hypothetical protein
MMSRFPFCLRNSRTEEEYRRKIGYCKRKSRHKLKFFKNNNQNSGINKCMLLKPKLEVVRAITVRKNIKKYQKIYFQENPIPSIIIVARSWYCK